VELARRVGKEPTKGKPGFRPDVYEEVASTAKGYGNYGIPNMTQKSVVQRFFMQPEPRNFTGDPEIFAMAFHRVKRTISVFKTRIARHGKFTLIEVQYSLNKDGGPGEPIKSVFKVYTKGAALEHQDCRAFLREFRANPESPIFVVKGKYELLEITKCPTGEVRTFEIGPLNYLLSVQEYTLPIQEAMLEGHPNSLYGLTLQHGGFAAVMAQLDQAPGVKFAGDVSKWDKNQCEWLLYVGYELTRDFYSDQGWIDTLDFIEQSECYSIYELPDGRVLQRTASSIFNSGTDLTTCWNNMKHWLIYNYHVMKSHIEVNNIPFSSWQTIDWEAVFRYEVFLSYADDHAGSGNKNYHTFARRSAHYADFGMTLKLEEDFLGTTTQGMKLLGFVNNAGIPVFDWKRVLTGLYLTKNRLESTADFGQIVAMALLASTDTTIRFGRQRFCDYVWNIVNTYLSKHAATSEELKIALGTIWQNGSLVPVETLATLWTLRISKFTASPETRVCFFPQLQN
jgi:hypothetical protein